eukprot:6503483-Prymnesium_polylepis.1
MHAHHATIPQGAEQTQQPRRTDQKMPEGARGYPTAHPRGGPDVSVYSPFGPVDLLPDAPTDTH